MNEGVSREEKGRDNNKDEKSSVKDKPQTINEETIRKEENKNDTTQTDEQK